jgi:hypothetical protein
MNIVGLPEKNDTNHIMNEASAGLKENNNSINNFS